MQSELGLVIHIDFKRILHKLFANGTNLLGERGAEHHNLLLCRRSSEDVLDVSTHIWWMDSAYVRMFVNLFLFTNLIQHFIAFIENEDFDISEAKLLLSDQSVQTSRSSDNDMRVGVLVGKGFDILLHWCASIKDCCLHFREIFAEPGIFVLDLVCEFTGVTHDKDCALAGHRLDLLKCSENEDGCLSETGLGLAENIGSKDGLRNAYLLDCSEA